LLFFPSTTAATITAATTRITTTSMGGLLETPAHHNKFPRRGVKRRMASSRLERLRHGAVKERLMCCAPAKQGAV